MRLLPCPSCGRHVRVADGECPFCGAGLTTSAPGWLSIALLGLALVGCDPGKPEPSKTDDAKSKADVQPQPQPEPQPEPQPLEFESTTTSTTTVAVEPEPPTTAVDNGAMTGDPPLEPDTGMVEEKPPETDKPPPMKPKYGAPRPTKKYGAPPKPDADPFG